MKESDRNAIIKLYVGDGMKARLKATCSMKDMTFTEFFMDAVFTKYPWLGNKKGELKEELQRQLGEVLEQLANSADLPESKRHELKERKNLLKKQIRQKEEREQKQREEAVVMDIDDFINDIMAHSKEPVPSVIPLPDDINLQPYNPENR